MKKSVAGGVIASAVAGLFAAGCATTTANNAADNKSTGASTAQVHCGGVNACKGQGSCGGASNSCKGQNACKGQGWSEWAFGGWDVGGIFNVRSGLPIDVRITRPDILYVDAAGNYFNNPAAGRTAVVNTPGGGASRNRRRPDLVPGVDPYVKSGGLLFLNPAALATSRA